MKVLVIITFAVVSLLSTSVIADAGSFESSAPSAVLAAGASSPQINIRIGNRRRNRPRYVYRTRRMNGRNYRETYRARDTRNGRRQGRFIRRVRIY